MTFRSPIFRRLFSTALLLIAAILIPADLYVRHTFAQAPFASPEAREAAANAAQTGIVEIGLLVALAAFALTYLYSRSLGRRIAALRALAEGTVDASPLGASIKNPGEDEIGALARSFDGMAKRFSGLLERAKVESAEREAILATMVEGVLAVDERLRITFSNGAFARAVGVLAPIPDRTPLPEVVRDPALSELLTEVLQEGAPHERRLWLVLGGEERVFEAQAAPLASPKGRGAIAVLYDSTHLERLERVRRDFVANVSHELRTPLTAIRGYAETLLDGGLEDAEHSRHFVEIIKAHAIRLGNITSDLLTLSELESGRAGSPPERVSVQVAVDSSLRTVSSAARLAGVRLTRGIVEEVDILGNRTHLEQVLVNLLDNGVKFNRPEGEVRVETHRSNGRITIVVEDTGIGIPSEHLSRIFERFYRVDKARSREAGGTGLGLSIVKHIVERMSGTVSVESNLGRGSRFTVNLPSCG
jgi:two-component system, OmpR family, phosphate regulon sensor histidine kinase PhoR